jgi:hypothetical protein
LIVAREELLVTFCVAQDALRLVLRHLDVHAVVVVVANLLFQFFLDPQKVSHEVLERIKKSLTGSVRTSPSMSSLSLQVQ